MGFTPRLVRFRIDDHREEGGQQLVSGRTQKGERIKDVPRPEPHGFTSRPPKGAVGIALALGPSREEMVVLGVEHPDQRQQLEGIGHQAIYDGHGNVVSLVEKDLRIVASTKLTIAAPLIEIDGPVDITGERLTHNGKNVGHDHRHDEVTAGADLSGEPIG